MTPISSPILAGRRLTVEEERARRARNRAIGLALAALVGLFYVVTMAKLGLHLPGKG